MDLPTSDLQWQPPPQKSSSPALPTSPLEPVPSPRAVHVQLAAAANPLSHTSLDPIDPLSPSSSTTSQSSFSVYPYSQLQFPTPRHAVPAQQDVPNRPLPQIFPFRATAAHKTAPPTPSFSASYTALPPSPPSPPTPPPAQQQAASPDPTASLAAMLITVASLLSELDAWLRRRVKVARRSAEIARRSPSGQQLERLVIRALSLARRLVKEGVRRARDSRKIRTMLLRDRRPTVGALFVACVLLVILLSSGDDRAAVSNSGSARTAAAAVVVRAGKAHPNGGHAPTHAADELGDMQLPHVHVGRAFQGRPRGRVPIRAGVGGNEGIAARN